MRRPLAALLLTALLALAGCAQPEVPREHFYRLAVASPPARGAPLLDAPLEVARPRVEGVTGERALLYAEASSPGLLMQYHYHLWADPPARMLQDALVEWLGSARVAPGVTVTEQRAAVGYRLASRLLRLEQLRGAPGEVRVSMAFTLLGAADGAPLWTAIIEEREATADDSVPAAVEAYERAVGRMLERLSGALLAGAVRG